ncbi:unnamed protein product [Penicillium olsonii]|nr:unnamed protein product [Penicillium olsonii]
MDRKQTRLTRCRTGCMRCRVRRRKCDEGKPRCRNCVDRNFQCQYGPQLTFLKKNAQTVRPSEVGTSSSYEAIRFIAEEPQNDHNEEDDVETPRGDNQGVQGDASHTEVLSWEPTDKQPMLSDKDESAVAGLLALGMNDSPMNLSSFSINDPALQALPSAFSPHIQDENTSTEIQALLRHYRYEIASWVGIPFALTEHPSLTENLQLDICDLGQSFGINGLELAMVSPSVWNAVLSLSETSFNQLHPHNPPREDFTREESEIMPDITHIALLSVLGQVKEWVSNISAAWASQTPCDQKLLSAVSSHAVGRDTNSAIYWLFVRLDLGVALATDSDMRVPLLPTFPYLTEVDMVADPFEMVFYYAYRPLWLSARAIRFMHNEEISQDRPPLHAWMELVEELEQWYRERPQEFLPMLELDMDHRLAGPEQSLPVVLFANGAGLFGNQLYHTAMLILLHCRPRTARVNDFHSTAMSPLWHAQRICSIALHNDRRECWDPCLLASFLMAARRMTHETQQQAVTQGFERIRTVTGWDTSDCLHKLQAEWCLLDET